MTSLRITVEENEAETFHYDIFDENKSLNIDISFQDNLREMQQRMGIIGSFQTSAI
ncbi:3589_t:CDS:2 [Funneliformis geosporum]|uniref:3589_t:CDS:1 n=1 Tax=Funneliformis geosporum TaxID=1117311 RepID=A0A9W4SBI2_9GLOM|nr:3589_t:CDS:2 [Funneliformis geosporum]